MDIYLGTQKLVNGLENVEGLPGSMKGRVVSQEFATGNLVCVQRDCSCRTLEVVEKRVLEKQMSRELWLGRGTAAHLRHPLQPCRGTALLLNWVAHPVPK